MKKQDCATAHTISGFRLHAWFMQDYEMSLGKFKRNIKTNTIYYDAKIFPYFLLPVKFMKYRLEMEKEKNIL